MNEIRQYANYHGHSDVTPFEVLEVKSDRKVLIRGMKSERDPSWTPKIIAGGFVGHCTNQRGQKWNIESDDHGPAFTISKRKNGCWFRVGETHGRFIFADAPRKFYDYNF